MLCAIDFSEPSKAALQVALSIAREGDADITILHVFDAIAEEPFATTHFAVPEFRREYECWAAGELQALVPEEARDWCRPTTRVSHGKAYREILGAAAEGGVDVIVMGVHGPQRARPDAVRLDDEPSGPPRDLSSAHRPSLT